MKEIQIGIDSLIEHLLKGGTFTTGVNVFNEAGYLVIGKDLVFKDWRTLKKMKKQGMETIPMEINRAMNLLRTYSLNMQSFNRTDGGGKNDDINSHITLDEKLQQIVNQRKRAYVKYIFVKRIISQVLVDIEKRNGVFDVNLLEGTVNNLLRFIHKHGNPFIYLIRDIFDYEDYLFNHLVNVCTLGMTVLNRFNKMMENTTILEDYHKQFGGKEWLNLFGVYSTETLGMIAMAYMIYDVGKLMIPKEILNKPGKLTESEFEVIKSHSYEKGVEILRRNSLMHPLMINCVKYHHGPIEDGEHGSYPNDLPADAIPPFVKILKFADIYDAITSKRAYSDAMNPVIAVSHLFRKYQKDDLILRHIIHCFVNEVGIYPAGSVVYHNNGQMSFILDSEGPMLLPFTDTNGEPLHEKPEVIVMGKNRNLSHDLMINTQKPIISPKKVYAILPDYIREAIFLDNQLQTA